MRPTGFEEEDAELRWYFGLREPPLGLRSNYQVMLSVMTWRDEAAWRTLDTDLDDGALDVALRVREIELALEQVGDEALQVLSLVYSRPPWRLRKSFGPLAGLVAHTTPAQQAYRRAGSPWPMEEWLKRLVNWSLEPEHQALLAQIRQEARSHWEAALAEYQRVRRLPPAGPAHA